MTEKKTRDQKFRDVFDDYLSKFRRQYNLPDLYANDLDFLNKNGRASTHQYHFVIPKQYAFYHVDVPYHDETGQLVPAGTIYKDQILPAYFDIIFHFLDYFGEYQSIDPETNELLSGCNIQADLRNEIAIKYPNPDDMVYLITVKYSNIYASYPPPLTFIDILSKQNIELGRRALALELEKAKLSDRCNRLVLLARTLYEQKCVDSGTTSECPVCYEAITPDKLHISECVHSTCSICSEKCTRCPICREPY